MPSNIMERLRTSTNSHSPVIALVIILLWEFVCTLCILWYIYKYVEKPLARAQLIKGPQ